MDQLSVKSETISAEICWVLNLVTSKYLMNSSPNSEDLFSVMFPDSDIAKPFQCGHTKAGYVAHFGLAPYFHELTFLYLLLNFQTFQSRMVKWISSFDFGTHRQTVLSLTT